MSKDGIDNSRNTFHRERYIFIAANNLRVVVVQRRQINWSAKIIVLPRYRDHRELEEREIFRAAAGRTIHKQNNAAHRGAGDRELPFGITESSQVRTLDTGRSIWNRLLSIVDHNPGDPSVCSTSGGQPRSGENGAESVEAGKRSRNQIVVNAFFLRKLQNDSHTTI